MKTADIFTTSLKKVAQNNISVYPFSMKKVDTSTSFRCDSGGPDHGKKKAGVDLESPKRDKDVWNGNKFLPLVHYHQVCPSSPLISTVYTAFTAHGMGVADSSNLTPASVSSCR
jgi:hypothetical protein